MTRTIAGILILLALAAAGPVLADGMLVSAPEFYLHETVQQAFLEWDAENGTETLSILPTFQSDANAFAWVVPVPGLPELSLADPQLFFDLDSITRPVYRYRDGQWNCFGSEAVDYGSPLPADNGVDVISTELVGYYQTMVLAATESAALIDSLTTWGFLNEDNLEDATAALEDYVARSWYFVTMQVDSTALDEIHGGDYYPYYYGRLDPITLTFPADEPVYPMKISAFSAADDTQVHLYVKADHRLTFPGADTHYANRFSGGELSELNYYPALRPRLQPGDFLTKLHRGYAPADMTEDVILVAADTDQEIHLVQYSGWPVTTVLLLGAPAVWGFRRAVRRRRR